MSGKFWRGAAASHGYNLAGAGLIELDIRVMFNHYMDTTDFMVPAPAGDVFFYCPVNCLQHVHYQRKRNGHHGKAYFLPRLHGGNTAGQNGAVFSAGAGNYWDHAAGGDIRLRRGLARLGVAAAHQCGDFGLLRPVRRHLDKHRYIHAAAGHDGRRTGTHAGYSALRRILSGGKHSGGVPLDVLL